MRLIWGLGITIYCASIGLFSVHGAEAPALAPPQIFVAGKKLNLQPAPTLQQDILIAPWASVAQAMGARVEWQADKSLLVMESPAGIRLQAQPDQPLLVGNTPLSFSPSVQLAEGRLVGPLKPLVEALEGILEWDPKTRCAYIWGKLLRVQTFGEAQGVAVHFLTSIPVAPTLQHIAPPRRSYIDLPGIYRSNQPEINYVNLAGVLRVRTGQFSLQPPVTRLVLDLAEEAPPAQLRLRPDGCGGQLIVGTVQGDEPLIERLRPKLLKIEAASPQANVLRMTAFLSDPIVPVYDVLRKPYRVLLDLGGAEIQEGLLPAAEALPFLEKLRLLEQGRLVLYMQELVPFTMNVLREPDRVELLFARDRLEGKKIMIDPGHGGKDSGARGSFLLEKDINLDVARRVVQRLALMRAQPFLTRDADYFVDLYERPRLTNALPADLFVSLHCNATGNKNVIGAGTGTYYCHPQSKLLAIVMQDTLVSHLRTKDYGVHQARFCVIRETQIPAVLVELLFIDNKDEEKLLAQPEFRQRAAEGVCEALRRYLEGTNTPSPALLTEPAG